MSIKSLLKSTTIISLATAVSRILGFVRDVLIARFFGTGGSIQAFVVAFRLPNLLRDIVAEGAANSAFVPVLSEYAVTKDRNEYWRLASLLLKLSLIVLTVIVIIGILAAPFIVRVTAPGFIGDRQQLELTIRLTRLIFPYILFVGLSAYAMGVLNSLKHFSAPAFAPALLNISIIAVLLICNRNVGVTALAWAVLIGGVLQLLIQLPALYGKGMRLEFPKGWHHAAVKKIGKLLLPRALGAAVYQLNVLVDTILASFHWIVGAGGIAALYYSNRLIQLPTAIFGIALATAILPTLSGHFVQKDIDKFKHTISFSLKALFFIMIPAAVGIMVLGEDMVRILFQRGEFTEYSTVITNRALFFYSFGLFSYAGIKIMVFSFYSMQDTITPVKTAAAALVINIILNLALMYPLKIGGLALATSIAGIFNFSALLYALKKKIGSFEGKEIFVFAVKSLVSAVLMGVALYSGLNYLYGILSGKGFSASLAYLLFYIFIGVFIYCVGLYILRVKELGKFIRWILRLQ